MELAAEWRQHGQPQLARLVQEGFDQNRAIVGYGTRQPLLAQYVEFQLSRAVPN